jgi:thiol:disulfide interchange protein
LSPFHRPSPAWALLLLPIALGAGWLLGNSPALDRPAPPAARRGSAEPPRSRFDEPAGSLRIVSSWTTYDAALDESRSTGKAILLDFNAAWCPPCRALQQQVFDHPDAGLAVRTEVVPVSLVDRSREDGANPPGLDALQARFRVDAFPTLVVYSPSTGREQRLEGYAGPERTLRCIAEAAAAVR